MAKQRWCESPIAGRLVDNRIIDLSMAAAREIDSVGAGVVPVRLEIVSAGIDPGSGFFTVQVGAFRERGNAERLRERYGTFLPAIDSHQRRSLTADKMGRVGQAGRRPAAARHFRVRERPHLHREKS